MVNVMGMTGYYSGIAEQYKAEQRDRNTMDAEIIDAPLMITQQESIEQERDNAIYHAKATVILLSVIASWYLLYGQGNING